MNEGSVKTRFPGYLLVFGSSSTLMLGTPSVKRDFVFQLEASCSKEDSYSEGISMKSAKDQKKKNSFNCMSMLIKIDLQPKHATQT